MTRHLLYGILALTLVALTGVHVTTSAQDNQTPQPIVSASPLILTLENNGGTFTVPVNSLIFLNIPQRPFTHLNFDPTILSLWPVEPMPESNKIYPQVTWRLQAIQPGITQLSLMSEPCRRQPCPMMPIYKFSVTIIVSGMINPPPLPPRPLPPPPIKSADVYIGTAYLYQTVNVATGQIITLDLPFLAIGRPVRLQFDPTIVQPLTGQTLTLAQPGGWQFQVIGAGTTVLSVLDKSCIVDDRINCSELTLFQVTLTTIPDTR